MNCDVYPAKYFSIEVNHQGEDTKEFINTLIIGEKTKKRKRINKRKKINTKKMKINKEKERMKNIQSYMNIQ